MAEKIIYIGNMSKTEQYIRGIGIGRFLLLKEVEEIVNEFGSTVRKAPGDTTIEIVPPIPKKELDKLGEALVKLSDGFDPEGPPATYQIG